MSVKRKTPVYTRKELIARMKSFDPPDMNTWLQAALMLEADSLYIHMLRLEVMGERAKRERAIAQLELMKCGEVR